MEVDMGAARGGDDDPHGHKRADPEKTTEGAADGGDAKRPRDGDDSRRLSYEMPVYDQDEANWEPLENPLDGYRESWIGTYGANGASFEDETDLPPMRNTDGPVLPLSAQLMDTMQVFTVKVTQITGGLQWPLDVYGVVAVRDSLDHKRNILFRRGRDECQTLTSLQDSLFELTGPSRAIVLMDFPIVEIDLKVKGKGIPTEDKALSYYVFTYNNIALRHKASYALTEKVVSENSTIEVRFAHLAKSVEATITIRVFSGSSDFMARFTARTASIDEEMVLLDSHGGKVAVASDGLVVLQRRIVVVEEKGRLILVAEATQGGMVENSSVVKQIEFRPRTALRSEGYFNLGFSKLHVMVAWSMLP